MTEKAVQLHSNFFKNLEELCAAEKKNGFAGAKEYLKAYLKCMSDRMQNPILDEQNDRLIKNRLDQIRVDTVDAIDIALDVIPEKMLTGAIKNIDIALDKFGPTEQEAQSIIEIVRKNCADKKMDLKTATSNIMKDTRKLLGEERYAAIFLNNGINDDFTGTQNAVTEGIMISGCYVNEVTEKPVEVTLNKPLPKEITDQVDKALADAKANPSGNPAFAGQAKVNTPELVPTGSR